MAKRTKKQEAKKSSWGGARLNSGRKMGTPTGPYKDPADKAVTVSLSMPGEIHRKLTARAESEGKSVNDAIREAIGQWVDRK